MNGSVGGAPDTLSVAEGAPRPKRLALIAILHHDASVMEIDEGDLIDGVAFAGAPAFLDFAGESDVQLFI